MWKRTISDRGPIAVQFVIRSDRQSLLLFTRPSTVAPIALYPDISLLPYHLLPYHTATHPRPCLYIKSLAPKPRSGASLLLPLHVLSRRLPSPDRYPLLLPALSLLHPARAFYELRIGEFSLEGHCPFLKMLRHAGTEDIVIGDSFPESLTLHLLERWPV